MQFLTHILYMFPCLRVKPYAIPLYSNICIHIDVREYRRGNQKGHSRETGNIGYTRRRKTNQTITQYVVDTTMRKQAQIT